ncbi:hypothetical protein [Actinomadura atramentaria]|uniref:hypothetical protein n=1 Tax=Actinomadura atramentaria TaxID=1990 RepID=UPI000374E823|nr:hypothetical protein [Actinomadura atramentaria]
MADRWFRVRLGDGVTEEQYARLAHAAVATAQAAGVEDVRLESDNRQPIHQLDGWWEELGRRSPWEE